MNRMKTAASLAFLLVWSQPPTAAAQQQCQPINLNPPKTGYFPFVYGCNKDEFDANPRAAEDGDGDGNTDDKLCSVYPDKARRKTLSIPGIPDKEWNLPVGKNAGDKFDVKDSAGNEFEIWCLDRSDNKAAGVPNMGDNRGGRQYGLKFIPVGGGNPVWVGRCKFEEGYNTAWWGKDAAGKFVFSAFSNLNMARQSENNALQKRDYYLFDVAQGCVEAQGHKRNFPGAAGVPKTNVDPLGKVHQWFADRPTIRAKSPQSFTTLISDFSTGTTDGPSPIERFAIASAEDSCTACRCAPDSVTVYVSGIPQGGSVQLTLFGEAITVPTSMGETRDSLVVHLVDAILGNTVLYDMGVRPWGLPGEIHLRSVVGGNLTVASSDGGLTVRTDELPVPTLPVSPWAVALGGVVLLILGASATRRWSTRATLH